MKSLLIGVLVSLAVFPVFAADKVQKDGIPGITGTTILVAKTKDNAGMLVSAKAKVGDEIVVTWSYPTIPEELPTGVAAKSDSASVKFNDIHQVVRPGLIGENVIAFKFMAKSAGKATLLCTVKITPEHAYILHTDVEVK